MKEIVPPLKSREEMLRILQEEEYGFLPPPPVELYFTKEENVIPNFCAGKAPCDRITAHCRIRTKNGPTRTADGPGEGKAFEFPFYSVIPVKGEKLPFFIHINFRPNIPDRYMPTEELIDNGFAVFSFCYNDVTQDDGDFTDKLAGVLYPDGKRGPADPGKIALWAWAAQRVMDYVCGSGIPEGKLDLSRSVVCGHSRLGKTALFCAATDERFAYAYSNESGCSGASYTRGKRGEHVKDICDRFPFWFCENYQRYADHEDEMPFDQHFLLASIAPRHVFIGSAEQDIWADPQAEKKSVDLVRHLFPEGYIDWHVREGIHYFSRTDWLRLMAFVKKQYIME
ncbi:MAG: hypothetical protein J5589_05295 [Firmicutes bacterium]|nr:hypothetical protein [Bacillota bacterium]